MKDEIKEILDDMKIVAEHKTVGVMGQQLNFKNARILLDYITNLQQELQEANESITWWSNRFKAVERDNRNYKSRNEKANWWLKEMLKQAKSDETKAIINGTLELLLNGGDEE